MLLEINSNDLIRRGPFYTHAFVFEKADKVLFIQSVMKMYMHHLDQSVAITSLL